MESFPQNLYLYGPLQGAILSLLPQRTMHINRIISCVSLAICIFPIFIITRNILHHKPKTLISQAATSVTLFIYTITLDDFYRNSGRPDQLGLFLSFCAMALVFTNYYNYLSPKWRGLVAVIITVLALLTKQYYGVVLIVFLLHGFRTAKDIPPHDVGLFEQRGVAVGVGKQIHHQINLLGTGRLGAQRGVEAPFAKLRLAQHARLVGDVFFQRLKYAGHGGHRLRL